MPSSPLLCWLISAKTIDLLHNFYGFEIAFQNVPIFSRISQQPFFWARNIGLSTLGRFFLFYFHSISPSPSTNGEKNLLSPPPPLNDHAGKQTISRPRATTGNDFPGKFPSISRYLIPLIRVKSSRSLSEGERVRELSFFFYFIPVTWRRTKCKFGKCQGRSETRNLNNFSIWPINWFDGRVSVLADDFVWRKWKKRAFEEGESFPGHDVLCRIDGFSLEGGLVGGGMSENLIRTSNFTVSDDWCWRGRDSFQWNSLTVCRWLNDQVFF